MSSKDHHPAPVYISCDFMLTSATITTTYLFPVLDGLIAPDVLPINVKLSCASAIHSDMSLSPFPLALTSHVWNALSSIHQLWIEKEMAFS